MQARSFAAAAPIAWALLTAGCGPSDPIEVLVEITTDLDCSMLGTVTIDLIDGRGAQRRVASTDACADGRVGSLVFLPGEKEGSTSATGNAGNDSFNIIVVAGVQSPTDECQANDYLGCIIARRSVSFGSATTVVPIALLADCVSVSCSLFTTCGPSGECVTDN